MAVMPAATAISRRRSFDRLAKALLMMFVQHDAAPAVHRPC